MRGTPENYTSRKKGDQGEKTDYYILSFERVVDSSELASLSLWRKGEMRSLKKGRQPLSRVLPLLHSGKLVKVSRKESFQALFLAG